MVKSQSKIFYNVLIAHFVSVVEDGDLAMSLNLLIHMNSIPPQGFTSSHMLHSSFSLPHLFTIF